MIGCCNKSMEKFKNKDGKIDAKRLDCLCEQIDSREPNKEWAEQMKNGVRKCNCPCHKDGAVVLC